MAVIYLSREIRRDVKTRTLKGALRSSGQAACGSVWIFGSTRGTYGSKDRPLERQEESRMDGLLRGSGAGFGEQIGEPVLVGGVGGLWMNLQPILDLRFDARCFF